MLLGVDLAARRADTAAVIAAAVEAKAARRAWHRVIPAWLRRPVSTVRGWLRAFTASAPLITEVFTALVHRGGTDAAGIWPAAAPTPAGRALSAVMAYPRVLGARFGIFTMAWQTAGLATAGAWFFSAGWRGHGQHELALMPTVLGREGGRSAG